MKVQRLEKWLQNYADKNHVFVGVNSDYSPCVLAFQDKPKLKYDEDDGYWHWTRPSWKTKFKWLDNEIPEELRMVRFDKSFAKRLFRPQSVEVE